MAFCIWYLKLTLMFWMLGELSKRTKQGGVGLSISGLSSYLVLAGILGRTPDGFKKDTI